LHWQRIIALPELHPGTENEAEIQQLKRQLDERTGYDRRQQEPASTRQSEKRSTERRAFESPEVIRRRQFHALLMQKFKHSQPSLVWPLTLIFSILMLIVLLAIFFPNYYLFPYLTVQAHPNSQSIGIIV
jgi:uncharacterized membrane protein (DUF485 family)